MDNRLAQPSQTISPFTISRRYSEKNCKLAISWLAGLIGGFTSATLCAPMDVARTRHILQSTTKYGGAKYGGFLQTVRKICSEEGVRGLYKGYSVTAVSIPAFHSLYFALFYHTKESLGQNQFFQNRNIFRDIVASVYAGVICNTVTNPLWVVRTRMQSQHIHPESMARYTGVTNGIMRIYREEGFKALFKGLGASYLGLSHAIILYPLYEHLKGIVRDYKGTLNTTDIFLTSLAAKFTAMVITYPHMVIRARLQDHRGPSFMKRNRQASAFESGLNEKATIGSVVRQTLQRDGVKGLYSGLRIDLVRVLPSNSIMFVMFELVKKDLERRWIDEEKEY